MDDERCPVGGYNTLKSESHKNSKHGSGERMNLRGLYQCIVLAGALLFAGFAGDAAQSQEAAGTLRGQVMDSSGAAGLEATVLVSTASGAATTATTNREGVFEVKGLA